MDMMLPRTDDEQRSYERDHQIKQCSCRANTIRYHSTIKLVHIFHNFSNGTSNIIKENYNTSAGILHANPSS